MALEVAHGGGLVLAHQARVAGDVGRHDRGQPPLDALFHPVLSWPRPRCVPECRVSSECTGQPAMPGVAYRPQEGAAAPRHLLACDGRQALEHLCRCITRPPCRTHRAGRWRRHSAARPTPTLAPVVRQTQTVRFAVCVWAQHCALGDVAAGVHAAAGRRACTPTQASVSDARALSGATVTAPTRRQTKGSACRAAGELTQPERGLEASRLDYSGPSPEPWQRYPRSRGCRLRSAA